MNYIPDKQSIRNHIVPKWYDDAKFGIFIHWGIYSIPAFAVRGIDFIESQERGLELHFKNNPYAEWYLNSLRIKSSPTQKYHDETYGKNFSYDDFIPFFNEEINKWNPYEWVKLFKKAGAKYVVLVTKHHDGFLLWPSKYPHPKKENYIARRNIVGEFSKAIKKEEIKLGLYYSGLFDWSFNSNPIIDGKTHANTGIMTIEYSKYATNHYYELIDLYKPVILWNDIGYPPHTNLYELFAYYYNKVPDGLINDRWQQFSIEKTNFPKVRHYDFKTPEYEVFKSIKKKKWETNRGIGNSFGYNKFETAEDYLTLEEIVHMLIDIVSKNGNLLLNVGPMADGTIPEIQKERLLGIGKWLEINGEAIYGTKPWIRAEGQTLDKIDIRFTQKNDTLYIHLLKKPEKSEITIENLKIGHEAIVYLLGYDISLDWIQDGKNLKITLPKIEKKVPAIVIKIKEK